jgi:putative tryptophan/tyrosine transport system substrate-binding protein
MKRREFITLLGGAAVAWPVAARAQPAAMPVIGSLNPGSAHQFAHLVANVRQGLSETGYVEGQNMAMEYRWGEGQNDRLPALAADLARRQVAVIITSGGMVSALAAKTATATIPIVFTIGGDPVRSGLVASLNRPGGNVTGVTQLTNTLEAKRLEVLHDFVPGAPVIAMLVNPNGSEVETQVRDAQSAARTLGIQIHVFRTQSEGEIDTAIIAVVREHMGALLVASDPFLSSRQDQLVALAARHRLPAIYQWREPHWPAAS